MMTQNHKLMIELANELDGSISDAVTASVENGLVSPSMLKSELMKIDDLSGHFDELERSVEFTLKNENDVIVAYGRSQTWEDALLHAVLGHLREHS